MQSNDLFSTERAGFLERLATLSGRSTWREPAGGAHYSGGVPDAHALAASLAYARRGEHDIGPDILVCVACQTEHRRPRIVAELAAALVAECGRVAKRNQHALPAIAARAYMGVVYGKHYTPPSGVRLHDYLLLSRMGEATLWQAAEQSLRLAERAYRAAA